MNILTRKIFNKYVDEIWGLPKPQPQVISNDEKRSEAERQITREFVRDCINDVFKPANLKYRFKDDLFKSETFIGHDEKYRRKS